MKRSFATAAIILCGLVMVVESGCGVSPRGDAPSTTSPSLAPTATAAPAPDPRPTDCQDYDQWAVVAEGPTPNAWSQGKLSYADSPWPTATTSYVAGHTLTGYWRVVAVVPQVIDDFVLLGCRANRLYVGDDQGLGYFDLTAALPTVTGQVPNVVLFTNSEGQPVTRLLTQGTIIGDELFFSLDGGYDCGDTDRQGLLAMTIDLTSWCQAEVIDTDALSDWHYDAMMRQIYYRTTDLDVKSYDPATGEIALVAENVREAQFSDDGHVLYEGIPGELNLLDLPTGENTEISSNITGETYDSGGSLWSAAFYQAGSVYLRQGLVIYRIQDGVKSEVFALGTDPPNSLIYGFGPVPVMPGAIYVVLRPTNWQNWHLTQTSTTFAINGAIGWDVADYYPIDVYDLQGHPIPFSPYQFSGLT